jgi:hypothetical protein
MFRSFVQTVRALFHSPTHLLDGAGIHTLPVTAGGGCQPVMVMVPYFTTK